MEPSANLPQERGQPIDAVTGAHLGEEVLFGYIDLKIEGATSQGTAVCYRDVPTAAA
jgi:hypothetical protein